MVCAAHSSLGSWRRFLKLRKCDVSDTFQKGHCPKPCFQVVIVKGDVDTLHFSCWDQPYSFGKVVTSLSCQYELGV